MARPPPDMVESFRSMSISDERRVEVQISLSIPMRKGLAEYNLQNFVHQIRQSIFDVLKI
jgi:hypothetical protein